MKKFFTKKESEIICSLLESRDTDNAKLGMNLIMTHSKFKSINKTIVQRFSRFDFPEYYWISPKRSFHDLVRIYNFVIKDKDHFLINEFFKTISKFVKYRTFEHK